MNSVGIGAPRVIRQVGTFLRACDKPLPTLAHEMGVRAEIELSRSGVLASVHQIENSFSKSGSPGSPPT